MGVDLLLRLQGALGAAQWKHQQQAEGSQARHVGRPLVHLQIKIKILAKIQSMKTFILFLCEGFLLSLLILKV